MMVSDNRSELDNAKVIASATGIKSLPSKPSSDRSGRNTMTMIKTPDVTGTITSRVARKTMCKKGSLSPFFR